MRGAGSSAELTFIKNMTNTKNISLAARELRDANKIDRNRFAMMRVAKEGLHANSALWRD